MNKNIEKILKNLPKNPGVYKFYNSSKIIYIGKSINLFNRVNSYFNGKGKLNFAKQKMVNQIENIEIILTNNETESLILETNFIKKHKPKYNILMKDDKSHIFIKITEEEIPKIIKTRIKTEKGTYFGPYISTNKVNQNLKIVKKMFGFRSCNIKFGTKNDKIFIETSNNTKIPCIGYYIKRCSGPCLLQEKNIEEYKFGIEKIKDFFKGNYKNIVSNLEEKMKNYAKELNFEEAQKLKLDIEAIKNIDNIQIINALDGDYDIINFIEKYEKFYIGLTNIRKGKINGYNNYEMENKLEEEKEDILRYFLELKYTENIENNEKNIVFLIPEEIKINKDLDIKIEIPKIGIKNDLLKLTYKNIFEYATKIHLNSLSTKSFSKQTMLNLLNLLGYKQINKNIIFECNDISHLSGNYTVASRSIIENGKTNNSKYKKFKIKSLAEGKIDDFSSLKEVIERRLKEIIKLENKPDLIIIDGGKGQLSSVMQVVDEMKKENNLLENLNFVSIAKREEELFLPYEKEPIILKKDSLELRLIQKIRDEAHRFAITFNRDSRIKAMKKNILESLPGFGAITRKKILKKYGNIENLKGISKQELSIILNKTQIETLENHSLI